MNDARQRWRLVVARGAAARHLAHRDVQSALEDGLRSSGLPLAASVGARPRPRIVFAAPVPAGMLAERELIDVSLSDRLQLHRARACAAAALPEGYELVDLFDVWVGAASLNSQVDAADYRTIVEATDSPPLSADAVMRAAAALLARPHIEVLREKAGGTTTVDIRAHVLELCADHRPEDELTTLRMRLRLGGEGGVGRPDEVVTTLGAALGRTLRARDVVRERIVLRGGSEG